MCWDVEARRELDSNIKTRRRDPDWLAARHRAVLRLPETCMVPPANTGRLLVRLLERERLRTVADVGGGRRSARIGLIGERGKGLFDYAHRRREIRARPSGTCKGPDDLIRGTDEDNGDRFHGLANKVLRAARQVCGKSEDEGVTVSITGRAGAGGPTGSTLVCRIRSAPIPTDAGSLWGRSFCSLDSFDRSTTPRLVEHPPKNGPELTIPRRFSKTSAFS